VRFWSTRRFVSTRISSDSGYALIETINGAEPARMFGQYAAPEVFQYVDATGAPASSAAAVSLIRAAMQPYAWRDGERVTVLRETFEWKIVSDEPSYVGKMVPIMGVAVPVVRCTDPADSNYGSMQDACTYGGSCTAPLSEMQSFSCDVVYGAGWTGTTTLQHDKGAYPGCAWSTWVDIGGGCGAPPPPPSCSAPTTQTQSVACSTVYGSGYNGTVYQQQSKVAPACDWGSWTTTGEDCVYVGGTCSGSETRTDACPAGYSGGGIFSARDNTGTYPSCSWTAWYETGRDCTASPPPPPPPSCTSSLSTMNTTSTDCSWVGQPSWSGTVWLTNESTTYSPAGCPANTSSTTVTGSTCAPQPNPVCPYTGTGSIDDADCMKTTVDVLNFVFTLWDSYVNYDLGPTASYSVTWQEVTTTFNGRMVAISTDTNPGSCGYTFINLWDDLKPSYGKALLFLDNSCPASTPGIPDDRLP